MKDPQNYAKDLRRELHLAIHEGRFDTARELAHGLEGWLLAGGDPPGSMSRRHAWSLVYDVLGAARYWTPEMFA